MLFFFEFSNFVLLVSNEMNANIGLFVSLLDVLTKHSVVCSSQAVMLFFP